MHSLRYLVNHIVPLSQFTSGFCLTNQSYTKNMFMPFKSVTTVSIFPVCLLISSSSGTNIVTSSFLVPFVLRTLNYLSIGFVLIYSSFASYLLIPVWVHSESTSTLSHIPFDIFIFVHTSSSLSLLSVHCGITYLFRDLLYMEVCYIILTPNLQKNPPLCHCFHCLILCLYFCSSSSVMTCISL